MIYEKEDIIAVDALAISRTSAGSFTVLICLIRELIVLSHYKFIIFVVSHDIEKELTVFDERCRYVYVPSWAKSLPLRLLWEQFFLPGLAKKAGCKLLYSASGYPELFISLPVVTHQQNLWPFVQSQKWWTLKNHMKSFLRRRVAGLALRNSRANLFISDYLRGCANALYPGTKSKNFTVHNAISSNDISDTKPVFAEWIDKPFCLSVSSLVIHKNYLNLLKSFKIATDRIENLNLVIVGNNTTTYGLEVRRLSEQLGLQKRVIFVGPLDLQEVYFLYKNALFSINISLLEGFGIPVLESMALGCPVICSKAAAFLEIGGKAVCYCQPHDLQDISQKMVRMYSDEGLREKCRIDGLEQSGKFNWTQSAKALLDIFKKILS